MKRMYWNSRDRCICCGKPPEKDTRTQTGENTINLAGMIDGENGPERIMPMQVHHIKYFPEICCYVHWKCHEEIHEEPSRHPHLIQYEEGDSRRFYG